jgi:hypothetical protein
MSVFAEKLPTNSAIRFVETAAAACVTKLLKLWRLLWLTAIVTFAKKLKKLWNSAATKLLIAASHHAEPNAVQHVVLSVVLVLRLARRATQLVPLRQRLQQCQLLLRWRARVLLLLRRKKRVLVHSSRSVGTTSFPTCLVCWSRELIRHSLSEADW